VYPRIIPVKNVESHLTLEDRIADLVYMIALHHELENPLLMLEESYMLLKPGGKLFVVDWKKIDMPEGPPAEIRYVPDKVRDQIIEAGFINVEIYDDLPKHFLVIGKKDYL
jgi:SAM-dependent methyltransferase